MNVEDNIGNLRAIQDKVDRWIKRHGGYWNPLALLAALVEEMGELSREITHLEGIKPKKPTERKGLIGEEIGDLMFSLICISNYYEVDLISELKSVINKYTERDKSRFLS